MPPAGTPRRVKRQPQRTCVACREVAGKRGLLRVVRTPAQSVEVDPTGKKSGRGAYVHASEDCARRALAGGLSRALKIQIGPEVAEQLLEKVTEEEEKLRTMDGS